MVTDTNLFNGLCLVGDSKKKCHTITDMHVSVQAAIQYLYGTYTMCLLAEANPNLAITVQYTKMLIVAT